MFSFEILSEDDIFRARQTVRIEAKNLGFGLVDQTRIVTAVSELTRNILLHAGSGMMQMQSVQSNGHLKLEFVFTDKGPGIPNIELAMTDGYSTGGGLGLGLGGTRRLVDEFEIESEAGVGTKITIAKILRNKRAA